MDGMGSRGRNAEREEENGLYAKSISIGTKFAARGCQVTGVTRGRARVLPERGMSTGANEGRRGMDQLSGKRMLQAAGGSRRRRRCRRR